MPLAREIGDYIRYSPMAAIKLSCLVYSDDVSFMSAHPVSLSR